MKTNQIILHILCSFFFLVFPLVSSPDFPHISRTLGNPNGLKEVITHILMLGFFYFSYSLLIPRLYFRQRYFLFYISVFLSALLIFVLLFSVLGHCFPASHHGPPGSSHFPDNGRSGPPRMNLLRMIFFDYSFYLFLIVLFASLLLKTNERWRKLQQEKLETELSYLKAQINPHFLFNTLNSIYALAIEKSDYTATAVVKLSSIMRYLISESGRHFVSLEQELRYISDYMELQQFRLGGTVKVDYQLDGTYSGLQIAPLILITFVENAFKYGVNPEEPSAISVLLHIEEGILTLKVRNNQVTTIQKETAPGLGISNTRNRLEKLYPGKHTLDITKDALHFNIYLKVFLI